MTNTMIDLQTMKKKWIDDVKNTLLPKLSRDKLEDFADFYRTGTFRADDWLSNATKRYMQDQSLAFNHSLSGFHFLGRKHDEVSAHDFSMNISGPIPGK